MSFAPRPRRVGIKTSTTTTSHLGVTLSTTWIVSVSTSSSCLQPQYSSVLSDCSTLHPDGYRSLCSWSSSLSMASPRPRRVGIRILNDINQLSLLNTNTLGVLTGSSLLYHPDLSHPDAVRWSWCSISSCFSAVVLVLVPAPGGLG